ncbi:hypothetical protein P154DRAFT_452051 [Amniculicola lignicola CBS 123094]|uniref:Uncharacterized protein n=1 Tax=Amniculicola lignicola CBS 123094 TaxID=1392246 RepID=A0A6A5VVN8_9PLEO|nr:hypothetical protein P154DRAFT_452051 [Amniculicola lignicola CBS 123094]
MAAHHSIGIPSDVPVRSHYAPTPDLPPRPQPSGNFRDRNCPNIRTCWHFDINSYSLRTSDPALLARRVCMIAVLGIRTAISVLKVIYYAARPDIVWIILSVILGVIGFFFIAWCLAKIGDAKGDRMVLGMRVGRWHFDVFLLVAALIHVGILVGFFFGLGVAGTAGTWTAMWLLIFAVAWIATWDAEPNSQV